MYDKLSDQILKEQFVALHLREIFKGEINPFYTINLGAYTYYYFIILDLHNEVLLSLATTSLNIVKMVEELVKAEEMTLLVGKYSLTYRDRILTCGSFESIRLKEDDLPYMDDAVKFAYRSITGPTLYSWLALFPPYIIEKNSTHYFYNENSRITASPDGRSCYGGFLLGSAYLVSRELREEAGELPFLEYSTGVDAGIKSIRCRPAPLGSDEPIECRPFYVRALVNKQLSSQLGFLSQKSTNGLLYLIWCPGLHVEKPVLVGLKTLSSDETEHFLFGKAMILSSLDYIDGEKVFRVWIPVKRLQEIYNSLIKTLMHRVGVQTSPNGHFEDVFNNHVKRDLIFISQKKGILPVTMRFYKRNHNMLFKFEKFARKAILETYRAMENEEIIYLERKPISQSSDFSSRALLLLPLTNNDCYMLI
jgi:hypothetical protein